MDSHLLLLLQATVAEQAKIDKAWKTQLAAMKKSEQAYKDAATAADSAYEAFLQGKQVRSNWFNGLCYSSLNYLLPPTPA